MRTLVVLATVCFCLVAGGTSPRTLTTDKEYVTRQKNIYQLFWHVDQPTTVVPELYQTARSYSIADHLDSYTNQNAVQDFLLRWKHGMLPRQEIFSVFYPHHLEDAKALFNVLYYSKDFNTFYNTAVWARFNVNEGLFKYVLGVAVIHCPHTKYMKLPPAYETIPHLFFNNEIIQQAYRIKMGDVSGMKKNVMIRHLDGGINDVIIHSNYSGWYLTHGIHSEEKLTYFTEDIGLNSFYFYFKHEYPFWLSGEDYHLPNKDTRGELYYHVHKNLLARYYLERLSNGMDEIEHIDWHSPIVPGFHPTINHPNGLPFPHRHSESHIPVYKYQYVQDVEDIETRVHGAIKSGFLIREGKAPNTDIYASPQGLNMLGNVIEGNADSVNYRYYESLDHVCKKILGFNLEPIHKNQIAPSALENFVTSMRDPIFYRIYNKIIGYFNKYKQNLPRYTQEQLSFPGVKIESVVVDKLTTFFDHFDSDISNGLPVKNQKDAEDLHMKVRQHRLNHKPYTCHITVNSDKNVKSMVHMFLGPKYDVHGHELDMSDNWMNFVEIDQWIVDLKTGVNKIEHSDHESPILMPDEISGPVFWQKLVKAVETGEQYTYVQQLHGFPNRLILPKGKQEGMPVKLMFYIHPVESPITVESPIWGPTVLDSHPMGYPLDRPLQTHVMTIPNMYWKDVMIYHKQVEELNLTV